MSRQVDNNQLKTEAGRGLNSALVGSDSAATGFHLMEFQKDANLRATMMISGYKPMWQGTPKHSWARKRTATNAYVFRHLVGQDEWLYNINKGE